MKDVLSLDKNMQCTCKVVNDSTEFKLLQACELCFGITWL